MTAANDAGRATESASIFHRIKMVDKADLVLGPHAMKGLYAMKKDNEVLKPHADDGSQVACYVLCLNVHS